MPVARELWSMVFTLFRVIWVMPKHLVELFASWPGMFYNPSLFDVGYGGRVMLGFLKEPKD